MKPTISIVPEKEKVETPKRQRLTPKERAALALKQNGLCGCGCGQKLMPGQIDEEHSQPLAAGGKSKPDSLWLRECHKGKTKVDRKTIKKIKHIRGETGRHKPGAKRKKIESAGFSKKWRKKIDGTIERKDN